MPESIPHASAPPFGSLRSLLASHAATALTVAAENIPGVKAVKDHLVWVEPTSGMVIEPPDSSVRH